MRNSFSSYHAMPICIMDHPSFFNNFITRTLILLFRHDYSHQWNVLEIMFEIRINWFFGIHTWDSFRSSSSDGDLGSVSCCSFSVDCNGALGVAVVFLWARRPESSVVEKPWTAKKKCVLKRKFLKIQLKNINLPPLKIQTFWTYQKNVSKITEN